MRILRISPILSFLTCLLAVRATEARTTIVVDFGPHRSAQAAGNSEASVDWLDADLSDDRTCTECFAALELQHYLRKMSGQSDNFAIVDDEAAPDGELFLVGGPASNAISRRMAP